MKRLITIVALALLSSPNHAQNFILNPGFETISDCPRIHSSLHLAENWESPSDGTPDLYNRCDTSTFSVGVPQNMFGNLQPSDGNGYAGIHFVFEDNYREYLKTRLDDCLRIGQTYKITFRVALSEFKNTPISSDFIGMHLSSEDLYFNTRNTLPIQPNVIWDDTVLIHESNKWLQISGHYTARGNERFMYLGNFHPNADIPFSNFKTGTYLFFDRFRMINPNAHFLSNCEKQICLGDSLLLRAGNFLTGQIAWLDEQLSVLSTDTIHWVFPEFNTTYYLRVDNTIIDSMKVVVRPSPRDHTDLLIDCYELPFQGILTSSLGLNVVHWSEGIWKKQIVELDSGDGWVYVVNKFGCSDTLFFSSDSCARTICFGDSLIHLSLATGTNPKWFFESNTDIFLSNGAELRVKPQESGMYYLSDDGVIIDSLRVYIIPKSEFDLEINCRPNINRVEIINHYGNILWSDGTRGEISRVLARGNHWVEMTNEFNCTLRKDFSIPDHCDKLVICPNDSVHLLNPDGLSGSWLDNFNDEVIYVDSSLWVFPSEDRIYTYRTGKENIHTIDVKVLDDYDIKLNVRCENEIPIFEISNRIGLITWENGSRSNSEAGTRDNTWVEVLRDDGCIFREELIYEKSCRNSFGIDEIFVPNVITPNSDGMNDMFQINGFLENMHLSIYNRWGRLIFYSENYDNNWMAENIPDGDYFYHLSDPKLEGDIKGWVKVIR